MSQLVFSEDIFSLPNSKSPSSLSASGKKHEQSAVNVSTLMGWANPKATLSRSWLRQLSDIRFEHLEQARLEAIKVSPRLEGSSDQLIAVASVLAEWLGNRRVQLSPYPSGFTPLHRVLKATLSTANLKAAVNHSVGRMTNALLEGDWLVINRELATLCQILLRFNKSQPLIVFNWKQLVADMEYHDKQAVVEAWELAFNSKERWEDIWRQYNLPIVR